MNLKTRILNFSAGRPVAIINKKTAEKLNIHVDERILIKHDSKKIIAVVDISSDMIKNEEVAVSAEIIEVLDIKEGVFIEVDPAITPDSIKTIRKKLDGQVLNKEEINILIADIVNNALTEAEIAYFVSAVYKSGMNMEEIIALTDAIFKTGKSLDIKGKIVDKHSIGGIPGNRTTPIIVSICAAPGLKMPKTSSRAITTSAGTADTLETITKVDFSISDIRNIVEKTNACMVWGGALGLAPADDKIIQVERLLNLDPEPQLLASIISKKLAAGAKYVIIDIPYGKTAKVSKFKALALKKKFEYIGKAFHIKIKAILTDGSQPIGNGIGPIMEMKDIMSVLKQEPNRPIDLEEKSLFLASLLLELCGRAKKGKGLKMASEILKSGEAYQKFKDIIECQGGKIINLQEAKFKYYFVAEKNSSIKEIDNKKINYLARLCGAPIEKEAGLFLWKHLNEKINKGGNILTLYSQSQEKLKQAIEYYKKENPIKLF